MNRRYKSPNKKINILKIIQFILFTIIIIGLIIIINEYYNKIFNIKLTNSQITVEEEIIEKDKMIKELINQTQELKNNQKELLNKQTELENKNKELEETIEKVRISKINKENIASSRSENTTRIEKITNLDGKWIWANVSAYCSCVKCCGKTNGITASGTKATVGRTIAAPSNYSFGTKIELEGLGIYTVEDRGGAIKGNKIDVYFSSHSEALAFGRKQIRMKVV